MQKIELGQQILISTIKRRAVALALAAVMLILLPACTSSPSTALDGYHPTATPKGPADHVTGTTIQYASGMISVPEKVCTYPYYVEPSEYPNYEKRPFHTMDWADFGDSVQLVAGREYPSAALDAIRTVKGTVWRPQRITRRTCWAPKRRTK